MALIRVHLNLNPLPPSHHLQQFTKFQSQPFLHFHKTPKNLQISSSSSSNNSSSIDDDLDLAMNLSTEIEKMKAQMVQTQEAMKASRKVLYAELGLYLGLGKEELRRKWEGLEEDEKWNLAEKFVSDWGSNFHPLSARSVKELVDQHLLLDDNDDDDSKDSSSNSSSFSSTLFDGLKKLIGF